MNSPTNSPTNAPINTPANKPLIVIGLATYQRPIMLQDALKALAGLDIPDDMNAKLILVDNDPKGSAEKVYQACADSLNIDSEYFIEGRRGISNIRNRILAGALEDNARYLAFFDDDERPSQVWLTALHSTIVAHKSQAVSGRVLYEMPEKAEPWIHTGQFFCDKSVATGSVQPGASTANVLIDLDFVREKSLRFHEAFNLSGGGDTFFFRKLISLGGEIVWSEEAVTHETVPLSRANESWILGRAYKVGFTTLLRASLDKNRVEFSFEAIQFITIQSVLFVVDAFISGFKMLTGGDKSSWVLAKRKLHKVNGALSFLRAKKHEEYQHTHGH